MQESADEPRLEAMLTPSLTLTLTLTLTQESADEPRLEAELRRMGCSNELRRIATSTRLVLLFAKVSLPQP